jgi:hypothetical protein
MYEYEDIDIPDFMKNKNKNKEKQIFTKEEIEKAFIKGGLCAIGCVFVLTIMFIFIAVIELI